ncbi:conserved protein of unknown function (plasmid) [Cupriavidus taiwanensis]|uniref:Uncharacterized protein n=1 Tax=Cupriavidus taiwanensis TaxID=164546 RepID=A0A375I6H3_9BURK|nr:conserved hypothetical protein [Cupriavidus taiwanensis]SOZ87059.1 conserved hypothetical protein [Cupriavidus taiwanensis]SOZ90081.1 conserved hypothetical protein [Cupriavidus taiwanensis]SOZ94666.1 conserved hypothetical protein [Cupriavidus taiwanensis]SPA20404.1 conserved hypothetical protein [Cupriavidus taiwanensis]
MMNSDAFFSISAIRVRFAQVAQEGTAMVPGTQCGCGASRLRCNKDHVAGFQRNTLLKS